MLHTSKVNSIMKATNYNKIGAVLALSLFSTFSYSQVIHRYVLEVETTQPVTYEAKKNIHGNYTFEPKNPRKTIAYYEVLSETPLTLEQCNDSIRLGKARRVPNPNRRKYQREQNLTMDGQIDNIWDQDIYMNDTYYEDPDLWDFLAD